MSLLDGKNLKMRLLNWLMGRRKMVAIEIKVDIKRVNGKDLPGGSHPKLLLRTLPFPSSDMIELEFNGQTVMINKSDLFKAVKGLMG